MTEDIRRAALESYLERGANSLDITPTMFKEVNQHYSCIADYLESNGIQADFIPFGSLATGTVVRPLLKLDDDFFDLDLECRRTDLCGLNETVREVRLEVEEAFEASDKYSSRFESSEDCMTLSYVCGGIEDGCRIDIVACVPDPLISDTAIRIAVLPDRWKSSDPEALVNWFLEANQPFVDANNQLARVRAFERCVGAYGAIEEVPIPLVHSSLQRAIQVLKRSRDIFYNVVKEPGVSSCALMVMVTVSSKSIAPASGIVDVIKSFICWIGSFDSSPLFVNGNWRLLNPVTGDNLLDEWSACDARMFYRWIGAITHDLDDAVSVSLQARNAAYENIMGPSVAKRFAPSNIVTSVAVNPQSEIKPWRP